MTVALWEPPHDVKDTGRTGFRNGSIAAIASERAVARWLVARTPTKGHIACRSGTLIIRSIGSGVARSYSKVGWGGTLSASALKWLANLLRLILDQNGGSLSRERADRNEAKKPRLGRGSEGISDPD